MAKDPVVVGLDLGGTNVRLALVAPDGEILARWERATATMPTQEAMVATLAQDLAVCGQEARSRRAEIQGVGLGIPGRILSQEGRVAFSPNIPALNDCPLVEFLRPLVPWPMFLENDANLFALGEYWLGAGVGHPNLLGITLGTGVGGGLILGGRLWQGSQGTTGEIGHITVEPEGQKCHCGNHGCLETLASASWTVAWVKEQLAQGAPSWLQDLYLTDPDAIRGETLVAAALNRDPLALKAFERVGTQPGTGHRRGGASPGPLPGDHRRPLRPGLGGLPADPVRGAFSPPHPLPAGGGQRQPGPTGRRRRPPGRRPPGLGYGGGEVMVP